MPTMELKKHGYDVYLSWQLDVAPDGHLRAMDTTGEWHEPDILWIQRHMGKGFDETIRKARSTGQQIWNDVDDDFAHLPSTNLAHETTDPLNNPDFNREHYFKVLAASTAITASTPALYREMEVLDVPVYLCRNMIDMERWPQLDPGAKGSIGWIGGVQWRAHDLTILKPFLPDFLAVTEQSFYHGGDSNVPGVSKAWDQIGIDPNETTCITAPLCHIAEYPKMFQGLNVSLIPLEDCRFSRAKSALKALESSASGLPYIASDLPEQRWFTQHGGAGRLAKNWKPQSWLDHLEDLLDPEVRRKDGAANRAHAFEFDIAHRWTQWDDAFSDVK